MKLQIQNGVVKKNKLKQYHSKVQLIITIYHISIFFKLDCEGGEYDIFTEENIDYLKNNVGYIVGEFHP